MQKIRAALEQELAKDQEAAETFAWMTHALQGEFIGWIKSARDEVERTQRLAESVDMLAGRNGFGSY